MFFFWPGDIQYFLMTTQVIEAQCNKISSTLKKSYKVKNIVNIVFKTMDQYKGIIQTAKGYSELAIYVFQLRTWRCPDTAFSQCWLVSGNLFPVQSAAQEEFVASS